MALDTYENLKSAIQNWLARGDLSAVVVDFMTLAQIRIYDELRVRPMEAQFSATISAGTVAVPSDYREIRHLYVDSDKVQVLEVRDPEWVYQMYPTRSADSIPIYIARDQESFIFGPYPDSTYVVRGTYYRSLDVLTSASPTNWITNEAPDLVLFGSLVEAAPYLGDDGRIPVWEGRFREARDRVQRQHDNERFPSEVGLRITTG